MKLLLEKLINHEQLSKSEASELLLQITNGEANDAQIVMAMSCLQMRGVSAEELSGFRDALLEQSVQVELDKNAIDVCGTGGDSKDTFNISTLAAFVIAGAGYNVVKHGNYGVSSFCGSSTVLEALGYEFTAKQSDLATELEQAGICFLHAPLFHSSLKRVGPIRQALGMRTFFNFLGPLVNPAQPDYQLTGVYDLQVARLYGTILSDCRKGFKILHNIDGYDEVSLTAPFKVLDESGGRLIYPDDIQLKNCSPENLSGGNSVNDAKDIFLYVLSNKGTEEQQSVVVANAALGIQCFEKEMSFSDAREKAEEAIRSGKALHKLKTIVELSQTR